MANKPGLCLLVPCHLYLKGNECVKPSMLLRWEGKVGAKEVGNKTEDLQTCVQQPSTECLLVPSPATVLHGLPCWPYTPSLPLPTCTAHGVQTLWAVTGCGCCYGRAVEILLPVGPHDSEGTVALALGLQFSSVQFSGSAVSDSL